MRMLLQSEPLEPIDARWYVGTCPEAVQKILFGVYGRVPELQLIHVGLLYAVRISKKMAISSTV